MSDNPLVPERWEVGDNLVRESYRAVRADGDLRYKPVGWHRAIFQILSVHAHDDCAACYGSLADWPNAWRHEPDAAPIDLDRWVWYGELVVAKDRS